jgi:hypothetical protein
MEYTSLFIYYLFWRNVLYVLDAVDLPQSDDLGQPPNDWSE